MAARLAWDNHKKRNQSIIVELLQVGSIDHVLYAIIRVVTEWKSTWDAL